MRAAKETRLFIVLGMHRSGTSAITRGLSVLGVNLGERLLPAVEGNNAKGFWEDIDLNALNIEMLKYLGSDWSHLAMITGADIDRLRQKGFFLRAVELLRRKVGYSPYFGFKDPRVAKLLPFWREVFAHCGFDVSYIFAMRNPLSVARSLGKRDGMANEQSYFLWLAYVVSGLINSADCPCVVVDYDRLMQAPEDELVRLAQGLTLEVDAAALQNYKDEFLDENLRHTVYAADDLLADQACPPLVHEVYATLLEVASDRQRLQDAAVREKIGTWFKEYEQLQPALRLSDKLLHQNAVAHARGLEQDERLGALQRASDERSAAQNEALGERDVRLAEFEKHLRSLDKQIVDLQHVVVEREGQLRELRASLASRDTQLIELRAAVSTHEARTNESAHALTERERQLIELRSAMAEREAQLNELRKSLAARELGLNESRSALAEREVSLNGLLAALAERETSLNETRAAMVEHEAGLNRARTALLERDMSLSQARAALAEREVRQSELCTALAECQQQLMDRLAQVAAERDHEQAQLQQVLLDRERQIAALNQTVQALFSSTSWRLSAPVRWLGGIVR